MTGFSSLDISSLGAMGRGLDTFQGLFVLYCHRCGWRRRSNVVYKKCCDVYDICQRDDRQESILSDVCISFRGKYKTRKNKTIYIYIYVCFVFVYWRDLPMVRALNLDPGGILGLILGTRALHYMTLLEACSITVGSCLDNCWIISR